MEAVAAAASLSRTTAYRAFGSATEMAAAIAMHCLEQQRDKLVDLVDRETDVIAKLETLAVHTQVDILQHHGLQALLDDSGTAGQQRLLSMSFTFVSPIVEKGQALGVVRADLTPEEITEWMLETVLDAAHRGHTEPEARRRFRLFIAPSLLAYEPSGMPAALLMQTERHLVEATATLAALRGLAPQ